MKTLLIFPPFWNNQYPYLSIPALKAHLTEKGHHVQQMDVNASLHKFFLSEEYLQKCLNVLKKRLSRSNFRKDLKHYRELEKQYLMGRFVVDEISQSFHILNSSSDFFIPEKNFKAKKVVNLAYNLIAAANLCISSLTAFEMLYRDGANYSSKKALFLLDDFENNFLIDFYRDNTIPKILREKPDVIGLSIVSYSQLIPALTLAKQVKKNDNSIHITIGVYGDGIKTDLANITEFVRKNGSTVFDRFLKNYIQATMLEVEPNVVGISLLTEYQFIPALMAAFSIKKYSSETKVYFGGGYMTATYDKLTSNRNLFSMMDGIFVGEGENALLALLQKLKNGKPLEGIPNFIPDEKTPLFNFHMEDLNTLPAPDFEGLNFHQYAYPKGITLYTSKGCYWGKCAFCSVNEEGPYREKGIEIVLDEMKQLHSKSGLQYITFADDLLSPSRMEIIAKFLIENNLYIKWDCQTRFSRDFTEEFCRLMKKSNNYFIAFGMESANKRILKHIRKGISHNLMHYVLSNCEKAGLNVILNCMLGFPSETKTEADETLQFPKAIKEKYPSLNVAFNTQITRIERNSDFSKEPEKYGVEITGENEFSTSIDWLQPKWVNEPIIKEKKHAIFNKSGTEIQTKNISIESGSLNFRPKKRYFTMCISSKYNLVKLSSTLIQQSNEIKLFAKANRVCFREAEENVAADSIVRPDNNHYHYIIISKIDSRVRGRRYKVSPIVKTVFELCDGKNTINDIILKVQNIFNTHKMPANRFEKNVVIAINQLLSIGAIFIPLSQKHEKIRGVEHEEVY